METNVLPKDGIGSMTRAFACRKAADPLALQSPQAFVALAINYSLCGISVLPEDLWKLLLKKAARTIVLDMKLFSFLNGTISLIFLH